MNRLLLLLVVLVSGLSNAQWIEKESTDEFGDPTGGIRELIFQEGKFSNSATVDSKAFLLIERTDGLVGFSLSDYGSGPNTYYKHGFDISVKKVNGEKFHFKGAVDTYSRYSGYKSTKWVIFENQTQPEKPSNWSEKKWAKHKAKYSLDGILGSLQVGYDVLRNLEIGDVIIIKEDTSTYKFIIK